MPNRKPRRQKLKLKKILEVLDTISEKLSVVRSLMKESSKEKVQRMIYVHESKSFLEKINVFWQRSHISSN